MRHIILTTLLLSCTVGVLAQPQEPRIEPDGRVTFVYADDTASIVQLKGSFIPKKKKIKTPAGTFGREQVYDMQRLPADSTIWTFTSEALPSEMYTYRFVVDGRPIADPANPCFVRDVKDTLSYFIIDGETGGYYMDRDVPHGKVERVWYPSTMNNMAQRRMTVYTPPTYDEAEQDSFPVLYLLHGSGGDETSWTDYGRAAQILDNMIAAGTIQPLIVVMPNGNASLDAAPGESPYQQSEPSALNITSMLGKIEYAFVPEVVGYVEQHYRARQSKAARAIAGLSLGGLQTIYISANNPDTFDYVGLFSAQTTNLLTSKRAKTISNIRNKAVNLMNMTGFHFDFLSGGKADKFSHVQIYEDFETKLAVQFHIKPYLYYIAVGEEDFVLKLNNDFRKKLDEKNYPYVYHPTDGAHTWENWRKYLVDFLPRLFKNE